MSAVVLGPGQAPGFEGQLRPANSVMDPVDMGGARSTRHSFIRTMMRRAVNNGWKIQRTRFAIDEFGCGSAIYEVMAESRHFSFVAFSQKLREEDRTDRVIAKGWDLTAALVEGPVDAARLERLAAEVPLQENGRAETGSIIWTRANRSERFFNYVVERLAQGLQPEAEKFGGSPYLIRSTAFYSNGKCGLADYEGIMDDHPLASPFRAHMLTAWLLRELSYDLVEQVASFRAVDAAKLAGPWRRYLGMGNATGLGMVPYAINHPEVINSWALAREVPLAVVTARQVSTDDPSVARIRLLLDEAIAYLADQADIRTAPFTSGQDLSAQLTVLAKQLDSWVQTGSFAGASSVHIWRELHDAATAYGPAARGMIATILSELSEELDDQVQSMLRCDESRRVAAGISCAQLAEGIDDSYSWIGSFDFSSLGSQKHFWFSSINNEEPRRALLGRDPGESVQHPVDIARAVAALRADLAETAPSMQIGEFLLNYPHHRATVGRVQNIGKLVYGEVRDNLLGAEFLPLNVQRFQLALYGMENFTPQSTDWLRVTLMAGAPRIADLAHGTADDNWMFTRRPRKEDDHA